MNRDQKDLVAEYALGKLKNKTYPEGAKTIDEKRKEKNEIHLTAHIPRPNHADR